MPRRAKPSFCAGRVYKRLKRSRQLAAKACQGISAVKTAAASGGERAAISVDGRGPSPGPGSPVSRPAAGCPAERGADLRNGGPQAGTFRLGREPAQLREQGRLPLSLVEI